MTGTFHSHLIEL